MMATDQQEVRECSKAYRRAARAVSTYRLRDRFTVSAQGRVERVLAIIGMIGEPTIGNVGSDGSQAISVLALHARVSIMVRILEVFEQCYMIDPGSVYHEAIPSLTDRILIIQRRKQKFGTQWMLGSDGNFFLPPVEDFKQMNLRRAAHGLGKSRHPIDLTNGVPKQEPRRADTRANDQRAPTEQEYQDFVYGSLD